MDDKFIISKFFYSHSLCELRDRPLDFLGGGWPGLFFQNIFTVLIMLEKNNLAQDKRGIIKSWRFVIDKK